MNFNLRTVLFEGPDCAGKTSAYREVHRHTKFKWNIHDRSTLSMLCYAIQYNRDADTWRELLREELNDLNNVMVVFLPPVRVILERLKQRGDEYQTVDTIARLYEIFETEVDKLKKQQSDFDEKMKKLDEKLAALEKVKPVTPKEPLAGGAFHWWPAALFFGCCSTPAVCC